jgi:hypothetical protein
MPRLVASLAGCAVLLAGVATGAAPASPADDPAVPARSALLATIEALATTSHDVRMETAQSVSVGSCDPVAGTSMFVDRQGSMEFDEMVQGGAVWIRINIDADTNRRLGVTPDQWLRLDSARIGDGDALPIPRDGADPIDMPGILAGVTAVQRADAHRFTGTIDMTKIGGRNVPDTGELEHAGEPATHAPFALTTDGAGRVATFRIDTSGFDPSLAISVAYSDYGAATPVSAPATSVPAPAAVYQIFGG